MDEKNTARFFSNLKEVLETPLRNTMEEIRYCESELETKRKQMMQELELERKEK